MQYTKQQTTQGAWVKASEVVDGDKAKLVSETRPVEGEFGTQDVAKISIEGDSETKNVRLNKATKNGFIDAFGAESKEWINKPITLRPEKMNVGGKRVTALYLIPEGYELTEDEGGYLVINKVGEKKEIPVVEEDPNAINVDDIPF